MLLLSSLDLESDILKILLLFLIILAWIVGVFILYALVDLYIDKKLKEVEKPKEEKKWKL